MSDAKEVAKIAAAKMWSDHETISHLQQQLADVEKCKAQMLENYNKRCEELADIRAALLATGPNTVTGEDGNLVECETNLVARAKGLIHERGKLRQQLADATKREMAYLQRAEDAEKLLAMARDRVKELEKGKLWLESELASARVYLEKSACSCYSYIKEGGGRETKQCFRCEGLDKLKVGSPCPHCNGQGIILHYAVQDHVDQETCEHCKGNKIVTANQAIDAAIAKEGK